MLRASRRASAMLMLTASLACPALSLGAPRPIVTRGKSSVTVATESLAGAIAMCMDFRSAESFGDCAQHERAEFL